MKTYLNVTGDWSSQLTCGISAIYNASYDFSDHRQIDDLFNSMFVLNTKHNQLSIFLAPLWGASASHLWILLTNGNVERVSMPWCHHELMYVFCSHHWTNKQLRWRWRQRRRWRYHASNGWWCYGGRWRWCCKLWHGRRWQQRLRSHQLDICWNLSDVDCSGVFDVPAINALNRCVINAFIKASWAIIH